MEPANDNHMDLGALQDEVGEEMDDVAADRICCIGAGRTGVFSMLVLAGHWPQKQFHIVDNRVELIDQWRSTVMPFHEPGLYQRILERRNVNLFFNYNMEHEIEHARIVFICVGIPTKLKGVGKKGRFDLCNWEQALRTVSRFGANGVKMIVEKSTVSVEFSGKILDILGETGHGHNFEVLSNPEFFSQGTAFENLENPSQIVIATKTGTGFDMLRGLYAWIDNDRIRHIPNSISVELAKIACSSHLAQMANFVHLLTMLCDKIGGADIHDVMEVVGGDRRINNLFFQSGICFGGDGLNKDVAYLGYLAELYGIEELAKQQKSIITSNKRNKELFVGEILKKMISLKGKVFSVYGFSYKRDTDDFGNSPAVYICQCLLQEGAVVRVYDPLVPMNRIRRCFPNNAPITVEQTMEAAWFNADAVCFLIDCQEFEDVVAHRSDDMYDQMRHPSFFIDGSNANGFNYEDLRDVGFRVFVPGRPHLSL